MLSHLDRAWVADIAERSGCLALKRLKEGVLRRLVADGNALVAAQRKRISDARAFAVVLAALPAQQRVWARLQ